MAKQTLATPEEMDLRRRARRRLVGAIALALVAVVVLPMLFDPEPRPLGSDVDIRIPDPATPFEPGLPPVPTPSSPAAPQTGPSGDAASPGPDTPPPMLPAPATPAPASPEPAKAAGDPPPSAVTPEKLGPRAEGEAPKPVKTPSAGFAAGYHLQLGVFSSEANARQLADKAAAAGFQVNVHAANGQARVRVGPFSERADALDMQRKLKAKGFPTVLLGP